jgi:hypothetical protein
MRFFGLGFFMESSPHWAQVLTLKQFHNLCTTFRVIKELKISRIGSVRGKFFFEFGQKMFGFLRTEPVRGVSGKN